MSVIENIDRRKAQRYEAAFGVRFSVNGGPEHLSQALNFTSRSLAVRSDIALSKGDSIDVRFDGLPDLKGEVARVFPEGFAIVLNKSTLDMMAREDKRALDAGEADYTISSPLIHTASPRPARAVISSTPDHAPGHCRHYLSIITANPEALDHVDKVFVSADTARWTAGGLRIAKRGERGIAVMTLNDWQYHLGAAYGLKLTFFGEGTQEWTLSIDQAPLTAHLETLAPPALAVSA